jgi:hypothetical protein
METCAVADTQGRFVNSERQWPTLCPGATRAGHIPAMLWHGVLNPPVMTPRASLRNHYTSIRISPQWAVRLGSSSPGGNGQRNRQDAKCSKIAKMTHCRQRAAVPVCGLFWAPALKMGVLGGAPDSVPPPFPAHRASRRRQAVALQMDPFSLAVANPRFMITVRQFPGLSTYGRAKAGNTRAPNGPSHRRSSGLRPCAQSGRLRTVPTS